MTWLITRILQPFMLPIMGLLLVGNLSLGAAYWWRGVVTERAVASEAKAKAEIKEWKAALAIAASEAVRLVREQEQKKQADAKGRIDELKLQVANLEPLVSSFADSLRRARAQSCATAGMPQAASAGQSPRPETVQKLPRTVDEELIDRLFAAERLRLSCVKLWEQAEADRK